MGIALAVPGLYFLTVSNKSLRALGSGTNAFRLTKHIVEADIYKYTRNPMSLGYYLFSLGVDFISGSTLLSLYVLFGLVPAHLFFLRFLKNLWFLFHERWGGLSFSFHPITLCHTTVSMNFELAWTICHSAPQMRRPCTHSWTNSEHPA